MTCKNCNASISDKFCGACGQKADVHRLTVGHLVHDFTHAITHADKGALLLVKALLWKPGVVAREYLEGKRKKYFNPFTFLVITTALSALASYNSGYYKALSGTGGGNRSPREAFIPYWSEVVEISITHGKLLGLILIAPLYTFLAWIFFWRPRYNFAEHAVLQSYTIGMFHLMTVVIFIPAFLLFPDAARMNNNILHLTYILYMGMAYKQFLNKKYIFLPTLKSILIVILFVVLFWILIWIFVALRHLVFGH
jgi:hypothetical protein